MSDHPSKSGPLEAAMGVFNKTRDALTAPRDTTFNPDDAAWEALEPAIAAYLAALPDDEETVERVAEAVGAGLGEPEAWDGEVELPGEAERNQMVRASHRNVARAALRALFSESAPGESKDE